MSMRYAGNGTLIFKSESVPVEYEVREVVTRGLRDHQGHVIGDPSALARLMFNEHSAKLEFEDGRKLGVMFPHVRMGDARIQIAGTGAIEN